MWRLAVIAEKHTENMAVIDTWNNGKLSGWGTLFEIPGVRK